MAKLAIKIKALLVQVNEEQIPHLCSLIRRINANDDTLPAWYTDKPAAYYEGLLWGAYATIEQVLMACNAYQGYGWLNEWDDKTQRIYTIN